MARSSLGRKSEVKDDSYQAVSRKSGQQEFVSVKRNHRRSSTAYRRFATLWNVSNVYLGLASEAIACHRLRDSN